MESPLLEEVPQATFRIFVEKMNAPRRSSIGYAKMDKEDPEERKHRLAQFLIYKAMEQADSSCRRRPSALRLRIFSLKIKIGRRFKRLRKSMLSTISVTRACLCKEVMDQFKSCMRLLRGRESISRSLPPLIV
ncbi:hypothetical protein Sjap_025254 [Stephania japonica]|uniref:Uncharacterized protein n=1 Tax=Stephania japonica TaxID=461633 RepID=A0AAP0E4I2_9MAGN